MISPRELGERGSAVVRNLLARFLARLLPFILPYPGTSAIDHLPLLVACIVLAQGPPDHPHGTGDMHACNRLNAILKGDHFDHVASATLALSPADSGPPASVTSHRSHRTAASLIAPSSSSAFDRCIPLHIYRQSTLPSRSSSHHVDGLPLPLPYALTKTSIAPND